jgi:diacylglycerol kinase (ATP)
VESTFVIVNPASANGRTGARWPSIHGLLQKYLPAFDYGITRAPGEAQSMAETALEKGYEMLCVLGGDGTLSEVTTACLQERLRRTVPPIVAPVRLGTGADFARGIGLSSRFPECFEHLENGHVLPCDAGLARFVDTEGRPVERGFLNIASFGLSGVVDQKVNQSSKWLGGRGSFLVGLVRGLASYRRIDASVEVDDVPLFDGPLLLGVVANGAFFGGGMQVAAGASIADGSFDVIVVEKAGLREVLSIADLYAGRIDQWATVRRTQGRKVSARLTVGGASSVGLLDIDGEQAGALPATFVLRAGALRLKVPRTTTITGIKGLC